MKIEIYDPHKKQTFHADANDEDIKKVMDIFDDKSDEETIVSHIDNFNISADAKAMLYSLKDISIKIGGKILYVGKKVIEFIVLFIKKFPNLTVATIIGLVISQLISSIFIIGTLLGPILNPLILALGLSIGFYSDIKNQELSKSINQMIAFFKPLNNMKLEDKAK
ncbi:hypothetical protein ACFL5P_00415 [candidate division KSB1 bacterium]